MISDHRTYPLNRRAYADPSKALPPKEQFRQPTHAYLGHALANGDQHLPFLERLPGHPRFGRDI